MNFLFDIGKKYESWNLERVTRHVIYWIFWFTFYTIWNGSDFGNYKDWGKLELLLFTVKIPFNYIVIYYLYPKFFQTKNYFRFWTSVLVLGAFALFLMVQINLIFPLAAPVSDFLSIKCLVRIFDLIFMMAFILFIKSSQDAIEQQTLNSKLNAEKAQAEIQLLNNQLQPHFLFNTLNNIYGFILEGNERAGDAVLKLSDILNYMLYECNVEYVSLQKEIDHITNYLHLEKMRNDEIVDISLEVLGEINNKIIAPLLLIGFVENAFKHGISPTKDSWIRIKIEAKRNEIIFKCENSVHRENETTPRLHQSSGIGLRNIEQRLKLIYKDRYDLKINNEDIYSVYLKLDI